MKSGIDVVCYVPFIVAVIQPDHRESLPIIYIYGTDDPEIT